MKKRAWYLALGVLGAGLLAGWAQAQPQPARPAPVGGRILGALERDWALICFDLQVSGAPFDTLRVRFQEAWTRRAQVLEEMQVGTIDRQALLRELERVQAQVDRECHLLLDAGQWARLNELRSQRRASWDVHRTP